MRPACARCWRWCPAARRSSTHSATREPAVGLGTRVRLAAAGACRSCRPRCWSRWSSSPPGGCAVLRSAIGALTAAEATCLMVGRGADPRLLRHGPERRISRGASAVRAAGVDGFGRRVGPAGRLAACTVWVILLQLWGDVASAPLVGLAGRRGGAPRRPALPCCCGWRARLAWWWIVALLLALLLAIVLELPSVIALRRRR